MKRQYSLKRFAGQAAAMLCVLILGLIAGAGLKTLLFPESTTKEEKTPLLYTVKEGEVGSTTDVVVTVDRPLERIAHNLAEGVVTEVTAKKRHIFDTGHSALLRQCQTGNSRGGNSSCVS
jgi:hypothetical protein